MPQARGTQTTIALFEESTYATVPVTPAGQKVYVTSCNIQAQQNLIDSNTLQSNRERSAPVQGNINVSGSIAFELGAESIGTIMKHAMGSNTTTGTDPYTHTMTLGDLPVGMVIEKDFGSNITTGRYQYFTGCRVGSMSMSFPQEGMITGSFDIVGSAETISDTPLDATLDDNGHTSFSSFLASIEEGGSAIATVTQCELSLSNELDESVYTIGTGTRQELPEGFATVTGTLTALFDSTTLLTKAINNTETSLKIIMTRGTGDGSAGNEYVEFFVQQMVYERSSPPIEGPGGILISLPFKGYISGATSALQVVIKNVVATI